MSKYFHMGLLTALMSLLTFALLPSAPLLAENLDKVGGDRLALIVRGGLLYDKWYGELNLDKPQATHPAYPKSGRYKGGSTWRCKECHGWDGRGKDGAYKSGKHFTGIVGIRRFAGGSESEVIAILKDGNHGYGGHIPTADLQALAAFVVSGQVDMNRYVDMKTKRAKGDIFSGKRLYLTVCARCHGAEGKQINFGSEKKPKYLGKVAAGNPWETLHKIRMGQPDEEMPSMLGLSEQQQVDILTYSISLAKKQL